VRCIRSLAVKTAQNGIVPHPSLCFLDLPEKNVTRKRGTWKSPHSSIRKNPESVEKKYGSCMEMELHYNEEKHV